MPPFVRTRMPPLDLDQGLAIGALHRYVADLEPYAPPRAPSTGKRVAIVGAGPAGLAAACYLSKNGHACTLYDAHPLPGGMLRYGIPANRLPKDALDAEIDVIRRLGAQFRMGQRWGEDFTLAGLRQQHDAVFLAIGAQRAEGLRCEGQEHALAGIDFWSAWPKGTRRRWETMWRWSAAAIPPWTAPLGHPAGRPERAGPVSPQPAGDALPDGGS